MVGDTSYEFNMLTYLYGERTPIRVPIEVFVFLRCNMAEKRYYWLKLKEDYFSSPKIKKLRKIAGGDTFTIIYLKLQLLSVKTEGYIEYEGIEPTFEEEIALKLDEDIDNVAVTLGYLRSMALLEESQETNKFFLIEASNQIGSEGQSAERKRRFDEKKKQALLGNGAVTDEKQSSISNSNSRSISQSHSCSNSTKSKKERNSYNTIINEYTDDDEIIKAIGEFIVFFNAKQGRYILNKELTTFLDNLSSMGLLNAWQIKGCIANGDIQLAFVENFFDSQHE